GLPTSEKTHKDLGEFSPEGIICFTKFSSCGSINSTYGLFQFSNRKGQILLLLRQELVTLFEFLIFLNSTEVYGAEVADFLMQLTYLRLVLQGIEPLRNNLLTFYFNSVLIPDGTFNMLCLQPVLNKPRICISQFHRQFVDFGAHRFHGIVLRDKSLMFGFNRFPLSGFLSPHLISIGNHSFNSLFQ